MKTITDSSLQERVDLDTLQGNRYAIEKLKPLLAKYITIQDNQVSQSIADQIRKLLDGKQTNLVPLTDGGEARLMLINSPSGLRINLLRVKARLSLRDEIMGYTLTESDKATLERFGHLGKRVTVYPGGQAKPFQALIGLSPTANEMSVLNVDQLKLPNIVLGVTLTNDDKEQLRSGFSIRKTNFVNSIGVGPSSFAAFMRINPVDPRTHLFTFEKIHQLSAHRPTLNLSSTEAVATENPASQTPLLDKLNLPANKPGAKGIIQFDNGTTVLLITQTDLSRLVLKITLPDEGVSLQIKQVFALPRLLSRTDAETAALFAQTIDRAIGQGLPLLPIVNQLPGPIAQYLPLPHLEDTLKASRRGKNQLISPPSLTPASTGPIPLEETARKANKVAKPVGKQPAKKPK